ncbi:MAG: hypothetical protein IPK67_16855 [Planctomycetes bacterium]|nr:hypothetical protein [Planctomycetota bacterium]
MVYTSKQKTEIRRAVELLTQVTSKNSAMDHSSMIEAQRQFQTLRDEMAHSDQSSVVLLASLGERLAGSAYKGEAMNEEVLRSLVIEIAEHVSKEVVFRDEPKPPMAKTNLKMKVSDLKLALRDGQRLGELLVRMTMLTPEQVEGAVKVQQKTGQRLGEALLQMRLLTPDMLESALRVQRTKRGASAERDNWSAYKGPAA